MNQDERIEELIKYTLIGFTAGVVLNFLGWLFFPEIMVNL